MLLPSMPPPPDSDVDKLITSAFKICHETLIKEIVAIRWQLWQDSPTMSLPSSSSWRVNPTEQAGHSLNHLHRVLVILSSRSQMVGGCCFIRIDVLRILLSGEINIRIEIIWPVIPLTLGRFCPSSGERQSRRLRYTLNGCHPFKLSHPSRASDQSLFLMANDEELTKVGENVCHWECSWKSSSKWLNSSCKL